MILPLEKQVTNKEISQRIKELGVKQESLFWWSRPNNKSKNFSLKYEGQHSDPYSGFGECDVYEVRSFDVSAFTVAELGEMLPAEVKSPTLLSPDSGMFDIIKGDGKWACKYIDNYIQWADTEADARGLMLIYLLENNLITL